MPLIECCEGCNLTKAVEIVGSFRSEMALCRSCREILRSVDGDLIELWARTGIRRRQVLEARIVAALRAAGLEVRYREEVVERPYQPEWQAAKAAIGEVEELFELSVD